jgi:hypothetical protein
MIPDTAGVSAIDSPITAGKGIDPLKESTGVANEACLPPPQAMSAHKVMSAPVSRIDLIRAELEPGSEPTRRP